MAVDPLWRRALRGALFFLGWWVCLCGIAQAAQGLSLPAVQQRIELNHALMLLEDASTRLQVDDVRLRFDWQVRSTKSLNVGYTDSAWWLHMRLHNGATEPQSLVLDLGSTQVDLVDWFIYRAGFDQQLSSGASGDFRPFDARSLPHRVMALPLSMEADTTYDVYVRIQSAGMALSIVDVGVSDATVFVEKQRSSDFWTAVFYGFLLLNAINALAIYVFTRWWPAGHLFVFVSSFLVYTFAMWGTDLQLGWVTSPWLHHLWVLGGSAVASVSIHWAVLRLLPIDRIHYYNWHRFFLSLSALTLLAVPLLFFKELRLAEQTVIMAGGALFVWMTVLLIRLVTRGVLYAKPLLVIYLSAGPTTMAYNAELAGLTVSWSWLPSFVDVIQYTALLLFVYFAVSTAAELRAQFLAKSVKEARLSMVRYVAHDLRAPMSAIMALIGRAPESGIEPQLKASIVQQVDRTVSLTEAFLWLSKAESSVYRFEPVYVGDVVHEAIDLAWPLLEKKQMTLVREGLDNESAQISADREMLVRCIFNLLENAAKYSEEGTTVTVTMARHGARVSLNIRDQGVGMSPEFVRQAFAEYRRSKNSFGESGFGLGLAFVATVIEQHGATIDCTSQPGQGSAFVLEFDTTPRLLT